MKKKIIEILESRGVSCPEIVADEILALQPQQEPLIVCICGSGRFLKQMHQVEEELTLAGKIVLMIGVNTKDVARTKDLEHHKPMLDELHLRKIDMANEVVVVMVDEYIGESTKKEIQYSRDHNKTITYRNFSQDQPQQESGKSADAFRVDNFNQKRLEKDLGDDIKTIKKQFEEAYTIHTVSRDNVNFIFNHQINSWGESTVFMHYKGYAVGHIYRYKDDPFVTYIEGLNVEESRRGRGLGRILLHLLEEMRYIGTKELNLWVEKDSWVHDWYKREGYIDTVIHDSKENTVWMKKMINKWKKMN